MTLRLVKGDIEAQRARVLALIAELMADLKSAQTDGEFKAVREWIDLLEASFDRCVPVADAKKISGGG